ncbi:hypothetical protein PV327_004100 [Microctonus hyperodae]|uniref:Uncharacterized protein n=1 Tax=Microctonus hyperodae TaxID=165561 RepID=A0AA39FBP7_MICHY|nr:hypothetical protein PV327_004100 [Microctonus hyperodae]
MQRLSEREKISLLMMRDWGEVKLKRFEEIGTVKDRPQSGRPKTTTRGKKTPTPTRDYHTSGTDTESNTETFLTLDTVFRPREKLSRTPTDKSHHTLSLIQVSGSQELNNTIMATSNDNTNFNMQEPAYWINKIAQNLITPKEGENKIAEYYEELNKQNLQRVHQEKEAAVQLQEDFANRRE